MRSDSKKGKVEGREYGLTTLFDSFGILIASAWYSTIMSCIVFKYSRDSFYVLLKVS